MEGTLEDRPIYTKTLCFDPFPFPAATPEQAEAIGALAERLDVTRKAALAEDERLTMTGLYNLVAAIRDGTLDPKDEAKAVRARARIVAKLHDAFKKAIEDPAVIATLAKYDMVPNYKSTEDYKKAVVEVTESERKVIETLGLAKK